MWQVDLTNIPCTQPIPPIPLALNSLIAITNPELPQWYHAKLFHPVCPTLLQAIKKGYFATWTNLTVELTIHLHLSMYTAKGNMKETRNNNQYKYNNRANPIRRGPDVEIGDTIQSSLNKYHKTTTKDCDWLHQQVPCHIQQGKHIFDCSIQIWQKYHLCAPHAGKNR